MENIPDRITKRGETRRTAKLAKAMMKFFTHGGLNSVESGEEQSLPPFCDSISVSIVPVVTAIEVEEIVSTVVR